MSTSSSRAATLAAQQVEQIVAAAQEAADQIRAEAEGVRNEAREEGKRDAQRIRQKAKDESEAALMESRKQAVLMGQQAKQEAEQAREQTRKAVEGRVANAERAAAEVLKEAQALSGGMHQLGRSLEEQANRILRDVQAAHRRMQADLRLQSGDELPESSSSRRPRDEPAPEPPPREAPPAREGSPRRRGEDGSLAANPFDDLDVPDWSK
jgi:hypothetical protein